MANLQSHYNPLEKAAAEFIERLQLGEHPSVAEYTKKYPACADEIRELFPTIADIECLKARPEVPHNGFPLGIIVPERLGDFRVVREIGRGGMGIVYEAQQESLGRSVAVKVLPKLVLDDPKRAQRFRREAQTAAKLHHTNIVPVFGLGQHEGSY